MTDVLPHPLPHTASLAESDFSIGSALSRSWTVFSRNLAMFCLVTAIASLPTLLMFSPKADGGLNSARDVAWFLGGMLVAVVLDTLSQAIVLYGAFQDMRGRPVDLAESAAIGLRRFIPLIVLAIVFYLAVVFASMLLFVPGLILYTMWFIATPPCVVERSGPLRSLGRSRQLTKGHRWQIFGIVVLLFLIGAIGGGLILAATSIAGSILTLVINLVWNALVRAYTAVLAVVIYRDLRVAKEGVDTDQIAAVFD